MLLEVVERDARGVDDRPAVGRAHVRVGAGEQPAEVAPPRRVADEQRDVPRRRRRLAPVRPDRLVDDVDLRAVDRPQPERLRRLRELHRPVDAVVVGERHGLVPELDRRAPRAPTAGSRRRGRRRRSGRGARRTARTHVRMPGRTERPVTPPRRSPAAAPSRAPARARRRRRAAPSASAPPTSQPDLQRRGPARASFTDEDSVGLVEADVDPRPVGEPRAERRAAAPSASRRRRSRTRSAASARATGSARSSRASASTQVAAAGAQRAELAPPRARRAPRARPATPGGRARSSAELDAVLPAERHPERARSGAVSAARARRRCAGSASARPSPAAPGRRRPCRSRRSALAPSRFSAQRRLRPRRPCRTPTSARPGPVAGAVAVDHPHPARLVLQPREQRRPPRASRTTKRRPRPAAAVRRSPRARPSRPPPSCELAAEHEPAPTRSCPRP